MKLAGRKSERLLLEKCLQGYGRPHAIVPLRPHRWRKQGKNGIRRREMGRERFCKEQAPCLQEICKFRNQTWNSYKTVLIITGQKDVTYRPSLELRPKFVTVADCQWQLKTAPNRRTKQRRAKPSEFCVYHRRLLRAWDWKASKMPLKGVIKINVKTVLERGRNGKSQFATRLLTRLR